MRRWPSLRTVLIAWLLVAACGFAAYMAFLRAAPRDELAMASDLSFQVVLALVVVGLPAVAFLFIFLFVGAIAKRWLRECPVDSREPLDSSNDGKQ